MTIQATFYILSSIVIVVVGIMLVVAIYYLISILRNTRNVSDDIRQVYDLIKKAILKIIKSLNKKSKKNEKK